MSQRYKIRLEDQWRIEAVGSDHVAMALQILPLLEASRIGELLAAELARRGFAEDGEGQYCLPSGDLQLTIDTRSQIATLAGDFSATLAAEESVEGSLDECGETRLLAEEHLREQLEAKLQHSLDEQREEQRQQFALLLSEQLQQLRPLILSIVDAVTIDALKEKAAEIGSVESIDEDRDSGTLSLVIEL